VTAAVLANQATIDFIANFATSKCSRGTAEQSTEQGAGKATEGEANRPTNSTNRATKAGTGRSTGGAGCSARNASCDSTCL